MANVYTAGDLNLSIQTIAKDTLKSLDAVIERLNYINNGLTKISGITLSNGLRNRAKGGSEKKFITNSDGQRYLALEKNVISAGNAIEKTTTKFNSQNKEISKSITKIDEYGNKITEVFNYTNKGMGLFDISKLTVALHAARKIGSVVADIVQSGADYAETLNLWQVAMRGYNDQATEFVNKMNKAYGISEKTLMNAQATFKNMLGSLGGIGESTAYQLSESVAKMAIDYSSLYNVGIAEAMTKFQAALAGQVRPIRSVSGFDITEGTLYQLYKSIGGTKTIRQLNQTEKRLLAIYAIFKQMDASGAVGDMERTINSFANQSRIMSESFNEVKSYSGLILTDILETLGIMQYINSILSSISELLKESAKNMGALEGQGDSVFGSIADNAEAASDAVDEANEKLLGFDKFRSLGETENEDVDIDKTVLDAMSSYSSDLNTNLAEGSFYTSYILSSLLGVATVLGSRGILAVVSKLTTSFGTLGSIMGKAFDPKYLGIGLLVGLLYYLYTTNEDFRESVNLLFEVLIDAVSNTLSPLVGFFKEIAPLMAESMTYLAESLVPIIEIVANIIKFLDKSGALKGALLAIAIAMGVLTIAIHAQNLAWLANPVTWIVLGIVAAIAILGVVIYNIIENIDEIWVAIKGIARGIGNFFANIGLGIANLFISLVNLLIDFINIIISPIDKIAEIFGKDFQIPKWDAKLEYNPIPEFANGGLPDKGTVFLAGEAGAEIVYNTSSGQSGVANLTQIKSAHLQALKEWWSVAKNDIPSFQGISDSGIYTIVEREGRRNGKVMIDA